jgi:protein-S-isoprenylcysteine O-methyltransferase
MGAIGGEAYLLGVGGGISFTLAITLGSSLRPFLVFCSLLSLFHMTEFLFAALYHSYTCSTESFLIPHSRAYSIAMSVSVVEYFVEWLFLDLGAWSTSLFWVGLTMGFSGQCLRWLAFVTAGHNFTHMVSENKEDKHVLVTDGIYKYIRHPGYCGWFWWSVGTQIMLANPVSAAGFFYFSWRFFVERIAHEEHLLESEDFFGSDYTKYKKRVPTYIPFID